MSNTVGIEKPTKKKETREKKGRGFQMGLQNNIYTLPKTGSHL